MEKQHDIAVMRTWRAAANLR